ncbi:MAG TPA: hypothetical protein VL728_02230 [Cyclobacteriaceae bacterium]|jgi:hypothetical protein|nr:hypothetical protein [Cyclobacteriaceae bacterium]
MINAFEYITVFISIILGLGVTQILTGIADLVHQSDRVKVYWPHLVWVLLVLVLHVQEWYITFELRSFTAWRLPVFLFVLLYPVVLFITARLLFPFGLSDEIIDLKEFYYKNYRKIFLFGAMLALISLLDNFIMRAYLPEDLIGPSLVLLLLSPLAMFKISNPMVHKTVALFMLAVLTITIIIQWDTWLIVN